MDFESTAALYEHIIRRDEAQVAHMGPVVVGTGSRTGRSPNDKFIVMEPSCADKVWWGPVNRPIETERFDAMVGRLEKLPAGKGHLCPGMLCGRRPGAPAPDRDRNGKSLAQPLRPGTCSFGGPPGSRPSLPWSASRTFMRFRKSTARIPKRSSSSTSPESWY